VNAAMKVYLYEIDKDKLIQEEESLLPRLPEYRRKKAASLNNPSVRAVSIGAGLLLVYALKAEAGLSVEEYDIVEGEHGKPEIVLSDKKKDHCPYINISHSGKYVAVVVADSPVGLDIEVKSDKDFKVTKRMFPEQDKKRILESPEPDSEFRDVWTEKEAYLKCTGEGISVPLKSFYTDIESHEVLRNRNFRDERKNGNTDSRKTEISQSINSAEFLPTGYFITTVRMKNEDFSISVCKDEKLVLDILMVSEL
jgi:Phosphopantetheinyl transferase